MAVVRVEKNEDFTVISNYFIKDVRLSLKAKGLLTTMLSLPDNWNYSVNGLITLSNDGKGSIVSAINELESFGYLRRHKTVEKDSRKFVGCEYEIFELPLPEKMRTRKFRK